MSDTRTFERYAGIPLAIGFTVPLPRPLLLSALLILLIVPFGGCASGMKMSSRRVCESAGGTYSGLTCYPNVPKGAEQMCLANGGVYLTSEDYCNIPIR
jgi:hypothetical protein